MRRSEYVHSPLRWSANSLKRGKTRGLRVHPGFDVPLCLQLDVLTQLFIHVHFERLLGKQGSTSEFEFSQPVHVVYS